MAKKASSASAPAPLQPTTPASTTHPRGSQQGTPTMSNSFSDILNTAAEDIKAPLPLPEGSYICRVDGQPEQGESSQKKTPYLRYKLVIVQPGEDVDPDAAQEAEAVGRSITTDMYITKDALIVLKNFAEACGVDTAGKTANEFVAEIPGQQVVGYVTHRITTDGQSGETRIRAEMRRFAKV